MTQKIDRLGELEEPRLKSKYFGFDNCREIAGV